MTVTGGQSVVIDAAGQLGTASGATGNADQVDGFDASASATANTLLALDVTGKLPADITGNAATATTATSATSAATATALAADGTECPADEAAGGVDASGNAEACRDQADLTAFGTRNTRVGSGALSANTTGMRNIASGFRALFSNTEGSFNAASGSKALYYNTTGNNNTASGHSALRSNTTGSNNTATGKDALRSNTSNNNTANGFEALRSNTTGSFNTASGHQALLSNTGGFNNTASGDRALRNNTLGARNTALGFKAGYAATTGADNIFLGSGAEGDAGDDNTIRIGGTAVGTGSGEQNRAFFNGIHSVTTGVADAVAVLIDSAGQLGTASSSERYKEDIRDMAAASERLRALRPVTFRFKQEFADGDKPIQFGLIAEEVAAVFPELVVYDEAGRPETVKYHLLSSLLLNEVQKLDQLESRSAAQLKRARQELAVLRGRVERLEAVAGRP